MRVKVLFFGAARDAVGQSERELILPGVTTSSQVMAKLIEQFPDLRRFGNSLLFAVNQEYAREDREVKDGDELAVFPPVSGGATADGESAKAESADRELSRQTDAGQSKTLDFFELVTVPIDVGAVARRVVLAECGATVTLDGYAREWTRGRRTLHLVYEAYAPMALLEMQRLGREARQQFEIAHIGIVHRTGKLEIGETSVVIAVSAPHRRAAFEACEWAIKELKRTVPIWKKEIFEDGEVWVEGEGSGNSRSST
ncbi:MAG TPA: molybdopterin converting factor subunit 1 [Pyrinomonadaceae bacterium]|nr:molybdopterin converting factor subunit 1 [Pyrinomonadaceae bacterium]